MEEKNTDLYGKQLYGSEFGASIILYFNLTITIIFVYFLRAALLVVWMSLIICKDFLNINHKRFSIYSFSICLVLH